MGNPAILGRKGTACRAPTFGQQALQFTLSASIRKYDDKNFSRGALPLTRSGRSAIAQGLW